MTEESEQERWVRLAHHCVRHGSRMAWGDSKSGDFSRMSDFQAAFERGWMDGYEGKPSNPPVDDTLPYIDGYHSGLSNVHPMPDDPTMY